MAARPEYMQPIRDEVESIVAAEGWTKAAMGKMWKLDSFLRESQRWNGVNLSRCRTFQSAYAALTHMMPHLGSISDTESHEGPDAQ